MDFYEFEDISDFKNTIIYWSEMMVLAQNIGDFYLIEQLEKLCDVIFFNISKSKDATQVRTFYEELIETPSNPQQVVVANKHLYMLGMITHEQYKENIRKLYINLENTVYKAYVFKCINFISS